MGYALLLVAWAFASPIGAAPDEAAHIVRAAAAGFGQFEGRSVAPYERTDGLTPAQADFLNRQTKEFSIPSGLVPPSGCLTFDPDQPAPCEGSPGVPAGSGPVGTSTFATTAPPFIYVLAGFGMRLSLDAVPPPYLGRVALALLCALLLGAAAWVVSGRGSLWPPIGLALAVTPMVVFLAASLGPAGVAVCAAICLMTAVVALWTGPATLGLLAVATLSGLTLLLARPSGLAVAAAASVVALPLVRARLLLRPAVLLALIAVAAGAALSISWALGHQPSLPLGGLPLTEALPVVAGLWPALVQQLVGEFGPSADVQLPVAIPAVWSVLIAVLIGAALVIGSLRDRLALLLAVAAVVVFAVGIYAAILGPLGWEMQGRYILGVAVLLPVLGGFVLYRAGAPTRADLFLVGLGVAAMQFAAFWENARRYAVGRHGPLDFVDAAQWTPPGGWLPWVILAGVGCALVALWLVPLTAAEREEGYASRLVADPSPVSVSR